MLKATGPISQSPTLPKQVIPETGDYEFLKLALDAHAIVSVANVKGDITYVNDKFCTISGYSREELLGANHRVVISGEHPPEFFRDLWRTIASGQTWHGEIKNLAKNGSHYWVRTSIVPNLDASGKPYQYIGIRTEITENKNNEEKLRRLSEEALEASRAKSEFLAAMSHEIRTPMTGVIGMSELLMETDLSQVQLDYAASIRTSGRTLMTILNEILDQSKLEAGKLDLSRTDFHLPSFVDEIIQLFGPKIASKGLDLTFDIDEDLPIGINADRMRIGQVLSNFLSNALKFTETGSINVQVENEPQENDVSMVRFTVSDSGIGLSKDSIERLFSAFTQADSSISRKFGGTGLGLSISKQLTEMMGGEIGVKSTKGVGSAFYFTVEVHPATTKVEAPDKRRSLDRWTASRPLKLLLAEDNVVNQNLITAIFKKFNHEITVVSDGKLAIEKIAEEDFDILLLDIRMPVMDGPQATKIIRAMEGEKSKIPIIALTADVSTEDTPFYAHIGIDQVCSKPIELPLLLKAMNYVMKEEIHAPLPKAESGATLHVSDNADDGFLKVLERVSSIADQVMGMVDEVDDGPNEALMQLGPDVFAELIEKYESSLDEQCASLKFEYNGLRTDPDNDDQKDRVKFLTHSLKGGGGSFGYHLITNIARDADQILFKNELLDPNLIRSLGNHVDALSLIADKNMSGNGGKAGRILVQGLKDCA